MLDIGRLPGSGAATITPLWRRGFSFGGRGCSALPWAQVKGHTGLSSSVALPPHHWRSDSPAAPAHMDEFPHQTLRFPTRTCIISASVGASGDIALKSNVRVYLVGAWVDFACSRPCRTLRYVARLTLNIQAAVVRPASRGRSSPREA